MTGATAAETEHTADGNAFDYGAVGEAVESKRLELNLTPSGLIRSVNWLSAAPLARLRQGEPTSCQHVNGLLRWLGQSPESFTPGMADGPECRIPDFGPYAVRWNMAALWEAVDAQRIDRGRTWDAVRVETRYADVEHIRHQSYGIAMHHAMGVVRWLRQPAATFMYPAELSPARPGSAAYGGPERAETERSAPTLVDIYREATQGKTDQEITDFARRRGGFPNICHGIATMLTHTRLLGDCEVGIDVGEGMQWTIQRSKEKRACVTRIKGSARAVLRTSPADFMRLAFQDVDTASACATNRAQVLKGDMQEVMKLFRP